MLKGRMYRNRDRSFATAIPTNETQLTRSKASPKKKGPAPGIPTGVPAFTANGRSEILRFLKILIIKNDYSYCLVNPSTIPVSGDAGTPVEVIVPSTDNSFVLKVILSILATLLLLNAFLYYKLTKLEASSTTPLFFSSPSIIFNK